MATKTNARTTKTSKLCAIPANDTAPERGADDFEYRFSRLLANMGSRFGRTAKTRAPLLKEARARVAAWRKSFVVQLDPTVLAMIAAQLDRIDGILLAAQALDERFPDTSNGTIQVLMGAAFHAFHALPGEWRLAAARAPKAGAA
ncbi:hypothetical protein [Polyangium sp. 6x1]|uniref:hypothetical protein n=1 Tax=Polyangium sp. 6x1 TaxID=3042689 RepID=UPI0024832E4A|nr:hypothetical protein [Polyangium sp. 6x1]MDI1444219.1 hypothetical protein [Polyangium sp. 6x1]